MAPDRKYSRRGRPPLLNEAKRRAICAILACGGTRTMAAAFAGCSVDTIARTAQRDPEFAAQIRRADIQAMLRELDLDAPDGAAESRTVRGRAAVFCRAGIAANRKAPEFGPLTAILAKMASRKLSDGQ
jgi:hypothetical protein